MQRMIHRKAPCHIVVYPQPRVGITARLNVTETHLNGVRNFKRCILRGGGFNVWKKNKKKECSREQ